jgi:hypothetical protein
MIDSVKPRHPFDERYNQISETDWETCSKVLNTEDKMKILKSSW